MQETILQSVGRTPLVRIHRIAAGLQPAICAKLESLNPGGSIKDRVALSMIAEAEKRGWLRPGGTIIEATAGNTGVGLAMVAAVKGYRCIFVLPDKMSSEKVALLRAYGAETVITPTAVAPDSPESYNGVADRLAREIPGAWRPNQFTNLANPEMHYRSTGPEIWEQTEGKITVLVGGVGTGGTLSGVAKFLKEMNPDIKVVGADPEGSVLSGGMPRPWKVEGIGEDFVPKTFNSQLVDDWVQVSDSESFLMARRRPAREAACRRDARSRPAVPPWPPPSATPAASPPTISWSSSVPTRAATISARCSMTAGWPTTSFSGSSKSPTPSAIFCVNAANAPSSQSVPATAPPPRSRCCKRPARDAGLGFLFGRGHSIVWSGWDPGAPRANNGLGADFPTALENGKPVGSIQEVTLARLLHDHRDPERVAVGEIMAKPLPTLDVATHIDEAYRLLLAGYTGVLATSNNQVVGIVTRIDLIQYWQQRREA